MARSQTIRSGQSGQSGPSGPSQPPTSGMQPTIPDKLYFRIGEVARLCEVPAYVLRFWESEFAQLKPNKGGTGQRLFRRRDVETALRIKTLLYDQGYTIPGARQILRAELKAKQTELPELEEAAVDGDDRAIGGDRLEHVRRELRAIQTMLSRPVGRLSGGGERGTVHPIRAVSRPRTSAPAHENLFDFPPLPTQGRLPER